MVAMVTLAVEPPAFWATMNAATSRDAGPRPGEPLEAERRLIALADPEVGSAADRGRVVAGDVEADLGGVPGLDLDAVDRPDREGRVVVRRPDRVVAKGQVKPPDGGVAVVVEPCLDEDALLVGVRDRVAGDRDRPRRRRR